MRKLQEPVASIDQFHLPFDTVILYAHRRRTE